MPIFKSTGQSSGSLTARKIKNSLSPSLGWKTRQWMRKDYWKGRIGQLGGMNVGKMLGFGTSTSELRAVHTCGKTGKVTNYGVVSRRVVTTAWVNFLTDQLQTETSEFGDLKWHDSGVGVTAAVIGDTDIETTDGEARVAGSQIEGATANIYKSVGTITYTSGLAITEHGLFTIITGGTMVDRHVFGAINVVSTDQIEFTYELTNTAGG